MDLGPGLHVEDVNMKQMTLLPRHTILNSSHVGLRTSKLLLYRVYECAGKKHYVSLKPEYRAGDERMRSIVRDRYISQTYNV